MCLYVADARTANNSHRGRYHLIPSQQRGVSANIRLLRMNSGGHANVGRQERRAQIMESSHRPAHRCCETQLSIGEQTRMDALDSYDSDNM